MHDRDSTRLRLETLAEGGISDVQPGSEPDKIPELLTALEAKEKEFAFAELSFRAAERAASERQLANQTLIRRLGELGIIAAQDDIYSADIAKAIAEAEALQGG